MTPSQAYIAFNLAENVGSVKLGDYVREYGDIVTAWENFPRKLSRTGGPVDWEAETRRAEKFGIAIVTPADAGYPRRLLGENQYPLALYVKGDVKALSKASVAIVGTRRATAYGLDQAEKLAFGLAGAGWSVLSGLALGIDAAAHRGALAAGGTTVGVIGSGLDRFYPEENRELAREIVKAGGAVVSQFPFGREPDRETFPIRNQVVAALSSGVVAVEAPLKSGTLITTRDAADMGRTVMAVPARVDSRMSAGCLQLIRDGAVLVRNAEDVCEALSELLPPSDRLREASAGDPVPARQPAPVRRPAEPPVPPSVSLEESMVLRQLDENGLSMDILADRSGFPPEKVAALCMALRLKNRVRYLPGNRVALR